MPRVVGGALALQPSGDRVHLCLGLRERRPGFEPRDHAEKMTATIKMYWLGNGRPKLWRFARQRAWRKLELWRHDADHRVALIVQRDVLTDNALISAEATLPEIVAQDHNAISARPILFGQKGAAQRGLDAHNREELRRDPRPV